MKHILKPVSCRCKQWTGHGSSKRVGRLTTGINQIPDCKTCGHPIVDHGWWDGVGIIHPGDYICFIAGQAIILRETTKQEIMEKEE